MTATKAELSNRGQDPELLGADESARSLTLPLTPAVTWSMFFTTAEILEDPPEVLARRFFEVYLQAQQAQPARDR